MKEWKTGNSQNTFKAELRELDSSDTKFVVIKIPQYGFNWVMTNEMEQRTLK